MANYLIAVLSFDIETGEEYCGILQLSAEIVRVELAPKTTAKGVVSTSNDTDVNVRREPTTFNSYVNPGEGQSTQSMPPPSTI